MAFAFQAEDPQTWTKAEVKQLLSEKASPTVISIFREVYLVIATDVYPKLKAAHGAQGAVEQMVKGLAMGRIASSVPISAWTAMASWPIGELRAFIDEFEKSFWGRRGDTRGTSENRAGTAESGDASGQKADPAESEVAEAGAAPRRKRRRARGEGVGGAAG